MRLNPIVGLSIRDAKQQSSLTELPDFVKYFRPKIEDRTVRHAGLWAALILQLEFEYPSKGLFLCLRQ